MQKAEGKYKKMIFVGLLKVLLLPKMNKINHGCPPNLIKAVMVLTSPPTPSPKERGRES